MAGESISQRELILNSTAWHEKDLVVINEVEKWGGETENDLWCEGVDFAILGGYTDLLNGHLKRT